MVDGQWSIVDGRWSGIVDRRSSIVDRQNAALADRRWPIDDRRIRVGILTVALALVATGVMAQPQPLADQRALAEAYIDTRAGLSLADAIARALAEEPSLRAARTEIDAARGMRLQARLRPNPTVSVERREEPAGTDNQTLVNVEVPLDLFRRSARVTAAEREIEATEQSVADRTRMLVGDIRMRYGHAAAAVRDLAVADNLASSARREFELLRRRVDEGASPPLERDLLEVELRRFESERLLAAGRADAAMIELKQTLGLRADTPLMLRDTLEVLASSAVKDTTVPAPDASVVRERPDVREAEARVRAADALIDRARSQGRFDISLFGSYMRMDAGFSQRGFGEGERRERVRGVFHYLSGGAMVMMPLWNRNQGEIAAARAARSGAAARLEAAQLAAQAEIATAASQEAQARRAVELIEGSVRLARQNLDVMRQTYELGRATVSEVLTEQRRYLEVEHAYTAILRSVYEARVELQRARGELP
jgi:outer membrane protein, heavy metal efflux system